jgi:hypothetical protein
MRHLLTILAAITLCSATAQAQVLKALMVNTTNGHIVATNNDLRFTNAGAVIATSFEAGEMIVGSGSIQTTEFGGALDFETGELIADDATVFSFSGTAFILNQPVSFTSTENANASRTNLGLGATNTPAFRGLISDGNIVITNQTATNNGILFVYRTNNEPFLGLANLLASNNTTISNETLFRVGVAEATNRSAQFGFRSTNTNGNGVAVFSVFGYNALMMVGADASTNAVIYSGGGTNNEVMTLIRDGATEFARPIRFSTNASTRPATNAPANTTNVAAWVEMRIGTNSFRVPLYQ